MQIPCMLLQATGAAAAVSHGPTAVSDSPQQSGSSEAEPDRLTASGNRWAGAGTDALVGGSPRSRSSLIPVQPPHDISQAANSGTQCRLFASETAERVKLLTAPLGVPRDRSRSGPAPARSSETFSGKPAQQRVNMERTGSAQTLEPVPESKPDPSLLHGLQSMVAGAESDPVSQHERKSLPHAAFAATSFQSGRSQRASSMLTPRRGSQQQQWHRGWRAASAPDVAQPLWRAGSLQGTLLAPPLWPVPPPVGFQQTALMPRVASAASPTAGSQMNAKGLDAGSAMQRLDSSPQQVSSVLGQGHLTAPRAQLG